MPRTKDNWVNIMKKDVSIENWLIRGTVFILVFTFGCFVWFQYKMTNTERYEDTYKVETIRIDNSSQTGQMEMMHKEINVDDVELDPTGKNSHDTKNMDDLQSERNIDKFHSSKGESKGTTIYPFIVECYELPKCGGRKVTILQTTENLQDILDHSGFEDGIASVRIVKLPGCPREGGEVTFYEYPNFSGVTLSCNLELDIIVEEIPDYKAQILSIKIEV